MNNKLTKKELKEDPFITIGRLTQSIKNNNTNRSLLLLQKLTEDISEMDIKLWRITKK